MRFLPIVSRELRVAARRRGTYWTRVAAAGLVLLIFGAVVLIAQLSMFAASGQTGPMLFAVFRWLAFAFVSTAGVFFTSDCLSEEKREGTLGLLFLTDLRGYDVVLGKLLAQSLLGTYGLLAAFPVIGLSILLGGVSGFEFWRLVLVLLNTLFFSLAAGMLVSSMVRDTQRALGLTMLICLVFIALLPLIDFARGGWSMAGFVGVLSLVSPGYTFLEFRGTRYSDFWLAMASSHGIAWLMLGLACFVTPRRWQDRTNAAGPRPWWTRLSSPARRNAWRERLLAANPVRWLAARDPWVTRIALLSTLGVVVACGVTSLGLNQNVAFGLGYAGIWLMSTLLTLWLASQASRFFVEVTRTGLLELILATPLPSRSIVMGHWWALRRGFLIPALLLFLAIAAQGVWQTIMVMQSMATATAGAAAAAASAGTNAPPAAVISNYSWENQFILQQIASVSTGLLNFFARLLAVAWFGMWMGLTTRKPNVAVLKTVLFVGVFPWMGYLFVTLLAYSLIGMSNLAMGRSPIWLAPLAAGLLAFGVNVTFFLLARHRLLARFRETFTRSLGLRLGTPPPLPAAAAMA